MAVHEAVIGLQFLTATLAADTTLAGLAPGGIWRALAPTEALTPYIVIGYQAGKDVTTFNGFRIIVDALFQAKAVGRAADMTTIASAAARIDQLIGSPPTAGYVTNGAVLASYREQTFFLDEEINMELWTSIGGIFRLVIEQMN